MELVPRNACLLRLTRTMTGAEIIAELQALGATPCDCEYAEHDRVARWREEGVFLYVGSPVCNAIILGQRSEILPRIAWIERQRKSRHRTKVSFALLSHVWHVGDSDTQYYVVVMGRPRMVP